MLLASCSTSTTTPTSNSTSTTSTTKTTSTTTKTTTSSPPTTTVTTTKVTGNWWDSLGVPQYGGSLTIRLVNDITCWDPYNSPGAAAIFDAYLDHITSDIWTTDPAIFNYQLNWRPSEFVQGILLESYEYTTPSTWVAHVRKGIHWENKAPANGRLFVASDLVAHYQRLFGVGTGPGSPLYTRYSGWTSLTSVTTDGDYTAIFKWSTSNTEFINELMYGAGAANAIECPDAVKQWGDLNDWHHSISSGAFSVADFVSGGSVTLNKNPNYWAHDERYPQNQLPYIDKLQFLIIPDDATGMAAMRTGKIDVMYGMLASQVQTMQKTNPEIVMIPTLPQGTDTLLPRNDTAPFSDIRVRQALQMSINLAEIATNYYGGVTDPWPSSLTSNYLTGWGAPYLQWPQDLKDQYAFNPTAAKKLLTDAGVTLPFHTDCVASTAYDMNLLTIVQSYFANVGVIMDIRKMDKASWTAYVRNNKSQDALAFGSNALGLTYEPFTQLARFTTNNSGNQTLCSDPKVDGLLTAAMAASALDDVKKIVADQNLYIAQRHFAISLLSAKQTAFCQPWLKGYNGQCFAVDYSAGGPMAAFYYCARFWIDKNVKTSIMGK